VAIAALLLWMCTAAVGGYLLATSTRLDATSPGEPVPADRVAVPEAAQPVRARNRFDPPSLARAKSEPLPGMRALAEFTHPALAIIGFGFWLGYVLSHNRVFAAIGFGILLGAIAAGLSWFTANTRAARRASAAHPGTPGQPGTAGQPDTADQPDAADHPGMVGKHVGALSFTPRLLILHGAGAVLTVLIAALIAARA
jgi:hypothetical protein